jgi:hypothetical protein
VAGTRDDRQRLARGDCERVVGDKNCGLAKLCLAQPFFGPRDDREQIVPEHALRGREEFRDGRKTRDDLPTHADGLRTLARKNRTGAHG